MSSSATLGLAASAIMTPGFIVLQNLLNMILGKVQTLIDPESLQTKRESGLARLLRITVVFFTPPALGAVYGSIGSSVLMAHGHAVLPVLEATRAGAVGGAILGPAAAVVFAAITFLLEPVA